MVNFNPTLEDVRDTPDYISSTDALKIRAWDLIPKEVRDAAIMLINKQKEECKSIYNLLSRQR